MVNVKIKKLHEDATLPSYAHEGDAGLDMFSIEDTTIFPRERKVVKTGIAVEFPQGHVGLLLDKSGLAAKKGITILGGVIDAHYRGEYLIIMYNTSKDNFEVKKGDKIAQMVLQKVEQANIEEVESLSETTRGKGRFGSTGGSNV